MPKKIAISAVSKPETQPASPDGALAEIGAITQRLTAGSTNKTRI
jgi:hypothetical protein